MSDHIYQGNCPDATQPDASDPECPACTGRIVFTPSIQWPGAPISRRDWFAGMALNGLLASGPNWDYDCISEAFKLADLAIMESENTKAPPCSR